MDLSDGADIPENSYFTVNDVSLVVHSSGPIQRVIHYHPLPFNFDAHRFENLEVARDYIDRWQRRRIYEERRFVQNYSNQFEAMIDSRGWRNYTTFPVPTNVNIVREFYASVSHNINRNTAMVRGVPISFIPTALNSFLCLPDLNKNEFNISRVFHNPCTVSLACNLLCPGAPWVMDVVGSHHNAHPASRFCPEIGEWRSFVEFRLVPPHLSYTINRHQLTIIYALLRGEAVDVGLTMYLMIKLTSRDFGFDGLPYGTFITALAKRAGVLEFRNDLLIQNEPICIDPTDDGHAGEVYSDMRDFLIHCAMNGIQPRGQNGGH